MLPHVCIACVICAMLRCCSRLQWAVCSAELQCNSAPFGALPRAPVEVRFRIDRTAAKCRTPRRNDEVRAGSDRATHGEH